MDPLPHVLPPAVDWRSWPPSTTSPRWAELITSHAEADLPYALLGIPSDAGIPTRPGARFGPDAIRAQWGRLGLLCDGAALSVEPLIHDLGNIQPAATDHWETHQRTEAALSAALTAQPGLFPLILGGDHSLTAPAFMAYQRFHGHQLGMLVFDAHYDVREWSRTDLTSGTPFRRILELGPGALAGRNLIYLGIRDFANSPHYHQWITEQGATIFDMRTIRTRGIAAVMAEAIERASQGTEGVWCSLDIDVVDQGDAPGASATGPGGLRSGDLLEAVDLVARSGVSRAFDVMEVSPPCDFQEMTSRLAAQSLATFITVREGRHHP